MSTPRRWMTRESSLWTIVALLGAISVVMVLGGYTIHSFRRYVGTSLWVRHTDEVLLALRSVRSVVNEAESGERGFVLTGEGKFLKGYQETLRSTGSDVEKLALLVADNPSQMARLQALRPRIETTLAEISRLVEDRKQNRVTESQRRDQATRIKSEAAEIRKLISAMEAEESLLLSSRLNDADRSAERTLSFLIMGFGWAVVLLGGAGSWIFAGLRARRQMETELRRFFASSVDMFCVAGMDGRFQRINPIFTETLGHTLEELQARPFLDFVHPEDRASTIREMEKLAGGTRSVAFENRYVCKDGSVKWLSWRSTPIVEEGVIYATARDVTEDHILREESTEARRAAQAANEAKSQFLANMSHEIRTPMNGVIGMTSLLLETKLSSEQQDFAQSIQISAQSLLSVINDILDFSKIEAGKLNLEVVDFDVDGLLRDLEKSFMFAASQKSIVFRVRSLKLPYLLRADSSRVRQVLANLIGNALKFTEHGTVTVTAGVLEEGPGQIRLRFEVEDSGIGIAQESLPRLFQVFSQADDSTSRRFGGTGLGLSISKQLVGMMGGQIGVRSALGRGSNFWFEIPFQKGAALSHSVSGPALKLESRERLRGRVLVAEDNQINQKVVIRLLERLGCKPHVVSSGKEVLRALSEMPFDLILMDCHMPELDGYETTVEIRRSRNEQWREIPIVALTANAIKGDEERCLAIGMNAYLSKPLNGLKLHEALAKFLPADTNTMETPVSIDLSAIKKLENLQEVGEADFVVDVVETFLKAAPGKLTMMEEALLSNRWNDAREEAHSLKSSGRTLGALSFGSLCQEMEDLPDGVSREKAESLMNQIKLEFLSLRLELTQLIAQRKSRSSPAA